MSVKPFTDVINTFVPLLQNEIRSFTDILESAYSMKTQGVETRFDNETCLLGEEAIQTRTKLDELTKVAMKEIEKANKSKIQELGGKEAKLLQEYTATKNCMTQEIHMYAH